jgi:Flp pilus assembly protein TadD
LQTAVRLQPTDPEGHNMLGSAFSALGRTTDAIAQFRIALKLRGDYQNARYNLARVLIKAGQLDEALDLFRKVVAAYPQDAQARIGLGELLFRQGKYQEALEAFEQAIELDPASDLAKKNRDLARERLASK